jgi:hypothetical protein
MEAQHALYLKRNCAKHCVLHLEMFWIAVKHRSFTSTRTQTPRIDPAPHSGRWIIAKFRQPRPEIILPSATRKPAQRKLKWVRYLFFTSVRTITGSIGTRELPPTRDEARTVVSMESILLKLYIPILPPIDDRANPFRSVLL